MERRERPIGTLGVGIEMVGIVIRLYFSREIYNGLNADSEE